MHPELDVLACLPAAGKVYHAYKQFYSNFDRFPKIKNSKHNEK